MRVISSFSTEAKGETLQLDNDEEVIVKFFKFYFTKCFYLNKIKNLENYFTSSFKFEKKNSFIKTNSTGN